MASDRRSDQRLLHLIGGAISDYGRLILGFMDQ